MVSKLVSGGQTGLIVPRLIGPSSTTSPRGGWCPKGRRAEDGPIDARYKLTETPTAHYLQRTKWNARDSEAMVIFTISPDLSGGSKKTEEFAKKLGKPYLHVHSGIQNPGVSLARFIAGHKIKVLNVAGTRGSKEPEVGAFVKQVLEEAFFGEVPRDAGTNSNDPAFMS